MNTPTPMVQVPVTLVLDPILSPSAKLIWMALRLYDDSDLARSTLLERRTGLSRKTVSKALAGLRATGWYAATSMKRTDSMKRADSVEPAYSGETVHIPADLMMDRRVGVRGRILYGHLQLLSRFRHPAGRFTYACLSSLTGHNLNTVRRAVTELVAAGWIQTTQKNRRAPVLFCLRDPVVERGRAEVDRAGRRLEEAPFLGEALMREYLSLLVDSEDFEDNAAPGFLVNPWTDERMELDRFTGEYAAKQRGRDYMKLGICTSRGIKLVVCHPEDLALENMRQKIDSGNPASRPGRKNIFHNGEQEVNW